ncbi:MAG: hypothetical protein AB7S36_01575, partial [Planctomycetota bacterium]
MMIRYAALALLATAAVVLLAGTAAAAPDDLTVTALGIPTTTAQASQDVVVGRFRIDSASTGTIGIDQVTRVGAGSGN